MKKLISMLLALLMLVVSGTAMALDQNDVFGAVDEDGRGHWNPPYDHSVWKKMVGVDLKKDATITAKMYDEEGKLFNVLMEDEQCKAGYIVINWPAVDMNGWHAGAGITVTYDLEITAVVNGETVVKHVPYSIIYAHDYTDHIQFQVSWYPHNTVCVAGVEFRDVRPELTNKWYNFAAIDLSEDGVQVFDLVASNMYVIGTATVTKTGDEVTVDWALSHQGTTDGNFQLENEFLTIFSDLDAVTEVEPSKFEGVTYEFGKPISIANDLNGDTNVLLYICNQATYCNNLSYKCMKPIYHPRYNENAEHYVQLREVMMTMVEADLHK